MRFKMIKILNIKNKEKEPLKEYFKEELKISCPMLLVGLIVLFYPDIEKWNNNGLWLIGYLLSVVAFIILFEICISKEIRLENEKKWKRMMKRSVENNYNRVDYYYFFKNLEVGDFNVY